MENKTDIKMSTDRQLTAFKVLRYLLYKPQPNEYEVKVFKSLTSAQAGIVLSCLPNKPAATSTQPSKVAEKVN